MVNTTRLVSITRKLLTSEMKWEREWERGGVGETKKLFCFSLTLNMARLKNVALDIEMKWNTE